MSRDLEPCPFCGFPADLDEPDTLYPGERWREDDGIRHYLLPGDKREGHGRTWTMHCPVTAGGCGAEISGDTREEAIAAWNRRAELSAFRDSVLEEAAVKVDALRDEHCRMTQMTDDKRDHCYAEGGDGCEFVDAWNDAAAAIRSMKGKP